MKHKTVDLEVKDVDEKGQVLFYFSAFGIKDSDGDITRKGTFTKTINENIKRIKHLKNHNTTQTPGVIKEMGEDEYGAWALSQLILKTQLGKDTYEEYKAGAITEHSYGYDTIKEKEDTELKANILEELKVYELSSLNFLGANPDTYTVDVKNEKQLLLEFDKLLKLKQGDFTDEYLEKIETKMKQIIEHIESLHTEGPSPFDAVRYLRENLKMIKNG